MVPNPFGIDDSHRPGFTNPKAADLGAITRFPKTFFFDTRFESVPSQHSQIVGNTFGTGTKQYMLGKPTQSQGKGYLILSGPISSGFADPIV